MILERSKQVGAALLFITAAAAQAQLRPARQHFVVPAEQVARAVVASFAARGIAISAEQVTLPAAVLANEISPAVEVIAMEQMRQAGAARGNLGASVRMRCKNSSACLPFYALVTMLPEGNLTVSVPQLLQAASTQKAPAAAKLVKAGTRLTMILLADHLRMQMEVVSLGDAALGQTVRVSTPDHKQTYTAEVVAANLVQGSL